MYISVWMCVYLKAAGISGGYDTGVKCLFSDDSSWPVMTDVREVTIESLASISLYVICFGWTLYCR